MKPLGKWTSVVVGLVLGGVAVASFLILGSESVVEDSPAAASGLGGASGMASGGNVAVDPLDAPVVFDGATSLSAASAEDLGRSATAVVRWLSGRTDPDTYISAMVSRGGFAGSSSDSEANGVRERDPEAFPDDETWRNLGTMGRLDELLRYYDTRFAPAIAGRDVEIEAWVGEQRLTPADFRRGAKGATSRFRPARGPATPMDEAWVRIRADFRGEHPCLFDIRFVRDRETGRWLRWAMSIAGEGADHSWAF